MLDPRQVIRFAKLKRIETPTIDWEQYEYRPELGWKWVQKTAFKILGWIGAHHMPVVTTFVRTPQENDGLLKSLIGQEGEWIELLHYGKYGKVQIFMGPDDHMDLLRLCDFREMQPFTLRGRIETSGGKYDSKWHDIPITVVPWMVGAAIVPR